ncbi:MAG: hypothetical protein KKA73_06485 [Chloroflexi bacterium]|nr:hypothetical protein [Chloroflexota bacterium]MBU1747318.1 hypothetical protein [Chloroflexota bacterium]
MTIQSDAPDIIELFGVAYERFRMATVGAPLMVCQVWSSAAAGGPALVIDGRRILVEDPAVLLSYAYTRILNTALTRVTDYYLFHAAALSHAGQGFLLTGPAGRGKTTLTLALLDRGYAFLSDDLTAISRRDGLLHPFPQRPAQRGGNAWRGP